MAKSKGKGNVQSTTLVSIPGDNGSDYMSVPGRQWLSGRLNRGTWRHKRIAKSPITMSGRAPTFPPRPALTMGAST
jgi:hypothetical protein